MSTGVPSASYEMAYVLFMDIVSYSLRSIDEQTEVLTILQKTVRESSEYQRALAKQELISLPTGDGMALVFLRDPASPVKCATEIAAALQKRGDVELRMGVHTGPVRRHADIKEEVNVVGGGVNMAHRVMDFGDSGHILVSQTVAEVLQQLRGWSDCLRDLGIHEVKHGVKVHLYNLCKNGVGNPARPRKLSSAVNSSLKTQTADATAGPLPQRRQRISLIHRYRPRHVGPFVFKGMLVICVVLLLRASLMRSPVGRHVKNAENTMLQGRLIDHYLSGRSDREAPLPVIIDISETIPSIAGHPTDIAALGKVIDALRELSPKAIGIDIDFSPERNLIRPTDWKTFSEWSQFTRPDDSKPLPLKLGVFRRLYDAPKNWLGRSEFRSLAAGMAVPEENQNNYYYVQAGNHENERLLQLAAALFEASGGKRPHSEGLFPILFTETVSNHQYGVYVVDYSYLQDIIEHQVVRYQDPRLLSAFQDKIKDNIVLIGDVSHADDKFPLAHTTDQVSGVLIHACSLMTLMNGPLLYVDTPRSVVLDAIVSFTSLLVIVIAPFIIRLRNPDFRPVETRLSWIVAFLTFLLCYEWIGWAGLFWPDFMWISLALFIYPFLADPLWRLIKGGSRAIRSLSQWIFKGQYSHAR